MGMLKDALDAIKRKGKELKDKDKAKRDAEYAKRKKPSGWLGTGNAKRDAEIALNDTED